MTIRVYCKALYDQSINSGKSETESYRIIANYVIEKWLSKCAFEDMVIYGFIKTYHLKQNALENMKLMKIAVNKIFRLDPTPFADEALVVLNKIYDIKVERVKNFFNELIELPEQSDLSIDDVFEEQQNQKYIQNSMCLSLKNIQFLYEFFTKCNE